MEKSYSIYTLASELKLSPGTVSRALRNRPGVREETRLQVLERANERGFKLRHFTQRATNICVLIQIGSFEKTMFSFYVDSIIDGVWRYCLENDLELSLFNGSVDKLNNGSLVRQLVSRGAYGAVVVNSTDESRFFREMKATNFPFCAVNTSPAEAKPWMVGVDDVKLSEQATSHFINLGHRRIGMLFTLTNFENGQLRLLGYKNALKNAGIPFDPSLICSREDLLLQAVDDFNFGASATENLLRLPHRPTAILSMSDEAAIGSMRTILQASLSIPRDMSLICFDDTKLAAFITPSLTVVNVPNVDIGFKAASIVHRRITHKDFRVKENLSSNLNGGLLVRESCGPAPKEL